MKISEHLIALAETIQQDEEKVAKGNASAAVRLRGQLMGLKKYCDVKRKEIQDAKKAAA